MTAIILKVAVLTPLRRYFDYLPPKDHDGGQLLPGVRVKVPFKNRELVGVFMGYESASEIPTTRLKEIIQILDLTPILPDDLFKLGLFAADYYHEAMGAVWMNALPALLRQGKPLRLRKKALAQAESVAKNEQVHVLNTAQKRAVETVQGALQRFQVFLLNGVTGSGKTEVYLQVIAKVLEEKKQILVLVPEIGLTPQTIHQFRARFCETIVTLHSGLTERERLDAWILAKEGTARIVIGTRSAIFTPMPELGLIIIDEEHDLSFKQQEGFRYHARDLAIKRAHLNHIPIMLGSATPALETLHHAEMGKYEHLQLKERVGCAKLPFFEIVDIRKQALEEGLSVSLLNTMQQHLARDEQVMLFLNRRGFAPVLMCHACGWIVNCKRCDMRMTYHRAKNRLLCHHCAAEKNKIQQCESCAGPLDLVGVGTERLENALVNHFKTYSIARIDRDSISKKGALEKCLSAIQSGEHRILIGTQMLAKGHHFPNVTLVAIVDADSGLFSSDFRGIERMGQLLLQVAGRAGRMEKPGKVIVQTHHPDHPLLQQLFNATYQEFASTLLKERAETVLPPFAFLALFRAEAFQEKAAMDFLREIKKQRPGSKVELLGPIPAPMPRRAGKHRAQLLVQAADRSSLHGYLQSLLLEIEKIPTKRHVRWSLDVDPLEMF